MSVIDNQTKSFKTMKKVFSTFVFMLFVSCAIAKQVTFVNPSFQEEPTVSDFRPSPAIQDLKTIPSNFTSRDGKDGDVMICFVLTCRNFCFTADEEDAEAEEDWLEAWDEWEEEVCGDN